MTTPMNEDLPLERYYLVSEPSNTNPDYHCYLKIESSSSVLRAPRSHYKETVPPFNTYNIYTQRNEKFNDIFKILRGKLKDWKEEEHTTAKELG